MVCLDSMPVMFSNSQTSLNRSKRCPSGLEILDVCVMLVSLLSKHCLVLSASMDNWFGDCLSSHIPW